MELAASLIDDARRGSPGAMDRLIEGAWPHAYRIALSILREPESAKDAAQDACAIVYRTIGQLREAAAFHVWFYRIVMRRATVAERKRSLFIALERYSGERSDDDAPILRVDVFNAIARLPRVRRACVVLHYYAQMNSREIGEVLELSDGTVRFHLHRSRAELAVLLGDQAPASAPRLANAHAL